MENKFFFVGISGFIPIFVALKTRVFLKYILKTKVFLLLNSKIANFNVRSNEETRTYKVRAFLCEHRCLAIP